MAQEWTAEGGDRRRKINGTAKGQTKRWRKEEGGNRVPGSINHDGYADVATKITRDGHVTPPSKGQKSEICLSGSPAIFSIISGRLSSSSSADVLDAVPQMKRPSQTQTGRPVFQHPSIMRACQTADCLSSSELLRGGPSVWDPPELELDRSEEFRSAPSGTIPAFAGQSWVAWFSADGYATSQTGSGGDSVQMWTHDYLCDRPFLHARSVSHHSLSGDSEDPAAASAPSEEAMFRGEPGKTLIVSKWQNRLCTFLPAGIRARFIISPPFLSNSDLISLVWQCNLTLVRDHGNAAKVNVDGRNLRFEDHACITGDWRWRI